MAWSTPYADEGSGRAREGIKVQFTHIGILRPDDGGITSIQSVVAPHYSTSEGFNSRARCRGHLSRSVGRALSIAGQACPRRFCVSKLQVRSPDRRSISSGNRLVAPLGQTANFGFEDSELGLISDPIFRSWAG